MSVSPDDGGSASCKLLRGVGTRRGLFERSVTTCGLMVGRSCLSSDSDGKSVVVDGLCGDPRLALGRAGCGRKRRMPSVHARTDGWWQTDW